MIFNFARKVYRLTNMIPIASFYFWVSALLIFGAQLKTNDVFISLLIPLILAQYLLSDFLKISLDKDKV